MISSCRFALAGMAVIFCAAAGIAAVEEGRTVVVKGDRCEWRFLPIDGTSMLPTEYMCTGKNREVEEEVHLAPFWIASSAVTRRQFAEIMPASPLPRSRNHVSTKQTIPTRLSIASHGWRRLNSARDSMRNIAENCQKDIFCNCQSPLNGRMRFGSWRKRKSSPVPSVVCSSLARGAEASCEHIATGIWILQGEERRWSGILPSIMLYCRLT